MQLKTWNSNGKLVMLLSTVRRITFGLSGLKVEYLDEFERWQTMLIQTETVEGDKLYTEVV